MVSVIFIDDDYLYKNFPVPKRLDRAAVLSIVQLEQFTSLQDIVGTCLYEHIENAVDTQTLTASEEGLFKIMQYSLCLFTANSIISILRTQFGATKNEEAELNQYSLDAISSTIQSKAAYINKRMLDYIKNDATIYAIATDADCTGDLFQEDDVYQGSVFYPLDGIAPQDCTE